MGFIIQASPTVLRQFSQDIGEWPENQILIPYWTYFNCPGATLVGEWPGNQIGPISIVLAPPYFKATSLGGSSLVCEVMKLMN
jgi:hypothetical protein